MTITTNPVRGLLDTMRERRESRARYADLKRELASYRTPREIDDLLGVIRDQDGPEAQQIRDILLDNLRRPTIALHRAA
jgi:hypothetical protein